MLHQLYADASLLDPLRSLVVRPAHPLPPPPVAPTSPTSLDVAEQSLALQLRTSGVGLLRFGECLSSADFMDLGRRLGAVASEDSPDVQPFVENGVILHLRQTEPTGRAQDAPFEARELLLHSEGSRWAAHRQPRYILLYCVDPGENPGAQTVLVSFAAVLDRLGAATREVLRETYQADIPGSSAILTTRDGIDVFSFRDLGDEPYHWDSPHSPARMGATLTELVSACYAPELAHGWHWSERDLLVIDNHRWFHGRTRSRPASKSQSPRHLMRLRIREPR